MNTPQRYWRKSVASITLFSLVFTQLVPSAYAASTDISDVPMNVKSAVKPNVAVILDNSQSMDAFMAGTLVAGDDPNTRGNIGRLVMRDTITTYRNNFNWGLMSFAMRSNPPGRYNTYAQYFGDNAGMVFTSDCVGGISKTNGNRRCVANPQPFAGGTFVTYDRSGDDPDILDVFYGTGVYTSLWGLTPGTGTRYTLYRTHNTASGNSWAASAFASSLGTVSFTPTDAGFLAANPPITRQLYLPRAWGYLSDITGSGTINEPVQADSATHFANLMAKLASETGTSTTTEIKNGALFTPLKGSLDAARTYYSSSFESKTSPIAFSCQQNFVMLVTDGLPTGDSSGNLYSTAARTNTFNPLPAPNGTWTFGTAASDTINSVAALRKTTKGTTTYDIQTYVVALGDTVANANAVAVMNAMAAAGGTNTAYLANDATSFRAAINDVADNIVAKTTSAASVGVNKAKPVSSDNTAFASSYNSGNWSGDLVAYPIDISTGEIVTKTPVWKTSAGTQLSAMTLANRKIFSHTGVVGTNQGIQFQPTTATTTTKLSTAQQTLLNSPTTPPGPADGAAVVAYLRGDRTGQDTAAYPYRARADLLGDIIHSEPLPIVEPSANYSDAGYLGTTGYKTRNATRTRIVVQGANDGMVHAFNSATGAEEWAYVPNLLMGTLVKLTSELSFAHNYYVDGTPVSNDVDFKNTDFVTDRSTTDWKTIVVGGLGKGGRGFYALDVTTTTASGEADAIKKALWEFPNLTTDATVKRNIGYSFGRPVIAKILNHGWVVLVTSGYNNGTNTGDSGGDGKGYLFVLNARTGELIQAISTGIGSVTEPSGLARITGYANSADTDQTVTYVYGGDLKGNVWRFDLTSPIAVQWNAKLLATLVDSAGVAQPVTTEPELANVKVTGGTYKRFVYVGTGRYLGDSDIPGASNANVNATQTQTMYGLVDDLSVPASGAVITPLRSNLQQQTLTTNADGSRTATSNSVNFTTKKGWYIDLSVRGERVDTDPALAFSILNFNSNIPNADPCSPGGTSFLNKLDYQTGGLITGTTKSSYSRATLATGVVLVQLPNGSIVGQTLKFDTTIEKGPADSGSTGSTTRRRSWIELMQ